MTQRRSPLFALWLALLLVFSQQQASTHAFEHEFAHLRADTKSTGHPDPVCAKCLVFAHLDHAADAGAVAWVVVGTAAPLERPVRHIDPTVVAALPYLSRAPPRVS